MRSSSETYRPPQEASRLKQVSVDPLEIIGLPSKGDKRLLNFETQEDFCRKVVNRYERWHSHSRNSNAPHGAFASLSLNEVSGAHSKTILEGEAWACTSQVSLEDSRELSTILMAMRKLREAIVASARKDTFALRAYAFMIRASILMRHMESYYPALLHLLRDIHPVTSLTPFEHNEYVGYYILDLSCRQNDIATAYKVGCRYNYKNVRVTTVLRALVHGNWYAFWKVKLLMSDHQQRLLEYSEEGMRKCALDCLGKSYLRVDREFLERSAQQPWEKLKDKSKTNWQLEGDVITIRQIKQK